MMLVGEAGMGSDGTGLPLSAGSCDGVPLGTER